MNVSLDELIETIRHSRAFFFKHLDGLKQDQWDWKPYPECKSIRETLAHLVVDDRTAMQTIATGEEPDYETAYNNSMNEAGGDLARQISMLKATHEQLLALIKEKYDGKPLDSEMTLWGIKGKVATLLPHLSSEDFYHAGQVGYIRMATDPSWDYYPSVYGIGGENQF
jgi:uncharacterized damage-inducible protein DinB